MVDGPNIVDRSRQTRWELREGLNSDVALVVEDLLQGGEETLSKLFSCWIANEEILQADDKVA